MTKDRKVIVFIAMSLDGFIAKRNDDLSFLSIVEQKSEDYGYSEFIKTVDTVILGRKTYDKVLSFGIPFPHAGKKTFVITHSNRPSSGNINFTPNLESLILDLKKEAGKNIFVDGGAEIINQLMQQNFIDEFIISIIPVLLGEGIELFKPARRERRLILVSAKSFEKGLVQLHYIVDKEQRDTK
jgi:dihydrofolate reductase